jgi:hypothetical protein
MKRLILTIILSVLPIAVNANDIMSWGIMSWGDDTFGQVTGSPSDSGNQSLLPWHRGNANVYFIDLAGGENHSLALRANGTLVSWGDDTYGQVGDTPAGDDYVAVATGQNHSLALKADGTLMSWGDDSWGQVSNAPPGNDYVAISGGAFSSLALKADGSIDGGNSDAYNHATSVPTGTGFAAVAAGAFHGLALKDNGTLVSWASDDYGQVSQTPSGDDFVAVTAGWWHSLALKDNGTLVSWGYDSSGQVSQTPPGNDFVAIVAGRAHSLALKANGSLISWGDDGSGQVSQNPGSTYNVFTAIAAGGDHSLALRAPPLIFEEDFEGGASDWVSAIVGPGVDDMSGGHDDGAYISFTADIDTSGGGDDGFYPVARCAVAPASAPSQNCSDGDFNGDWYFTKGVQELRFWFRHNSAKPGGLQPAIRVATPGNWPSGLAVFPAVAAQTWTQNTVQIDLLDPAWDPNWGAYAGASVPDAVAVFRDVGRLQVGYYVDPNGPAGGPSLDAIQDQVFTPACSFCHSGGTGSGDLPASLDLSSASASFTSLVGVESLQVMGVDLVVPGDPDGSYLIQKLEDANGIGGSQMPRNSAPLDQSVIDDVRLWISNGPAYAESNATFDFDDVQIRGVDTIPVVVDVITGGGQYGHGHVHQPIHLNHDGGPDAITGLDDRVRLMVFGAATGVGDPVSLDTDDIVASSVRIGRLAGPHIDGEQLFGLDHDADGLDDAEFAVLTGDAFGRAALAEGSCQGAWSKPNEVAFRAELATGQIIAGQDWVIPRSCNAQCHP